MPVALDSAWNVFETTTPSSISEVIRYYSCKIFKFTELKLILRYRGVDISILYTSLNTVLPLEERRNYSFEIYCCSNDEFHFQALMFKRPPSTGLCKNYMSYHTEGLKNGLYLVFKNKVHMIFVQRDALYKTWYRICMVFRMAS
jgi:hypothetical protein